VKTTRRIFVGITIPVLFASYASAQVKQVTVDIPKDFNPDKQVLWLDVKHKEIGRCGDISLHYDGPAPSGLSLEIYHRELSPNLPAGTEVISVNSDDKKLTRLLKQGGKLSMRVNRPYLITEMKLRVTDADTTQVPCPVCKGSGKNHAAQCPLCRGVGHCRKTDADICAGMVILEDGKKKYQVRDPQTGGVILKDSPGPDQEY
jgi:hypothetical protein